MGEVTGISWCHHTINIWTGCTRVSEACRFCYAETFSNRDLPNIGKWGPKAPRRPMAESGWKNLEKWNRKAKKAGERRRVFCCSLCDIGERNETMPEESWPVVAAQRARLWDEIERCPDLDFLLLSKRIDHLGQLLAARWPGGLPKNIWAGTSVENQEAADERIPQLVAIPARIRFLSCEPLLGPVNLRLYPFLSRVSGLRYQTAAAAGDHGVVPPCIHWVIVGGESGAHARPMHPAWARSLRDQCVASGVPFHFKQWGRWSPWDPGLPIDVRHVSARDGAMGAQPGYVGLADPLARIEARADTVPMIGIGKHAAGRLLDGREWNEIPECT